MGKKAVPEAREPARAADTGSSLMLYLITSKTHGEEGSSFFNKLPCLWLSRAIDSGTSLTAVTL